MRAKICDIPSIDFLHALADAADAQTLPRFRARLSIDTKHNEGDSFDPVTDADRYAELAMRTLIKQTYPHHAILGEEMGQEGAGNICWVLDPIDGTKPYICGIPVWGTLIGLTENGLAISGMMSQPFTGERFWADETFAWFRRGEKVTRIKTRNVTLENAILHTTSPYGYKGSLANGFINLQSRVRMTRYGGECYGMVMVAAGHIDLALEPSLKPYDIVALIPIIEKAGGVVTNVNGDRPEEGGPVLISGSAELHSQALELLNQSS